MNTDTRPNGDEAALRQLFEHCMSDGGMWEAAIERSGEGYKLAGAQVAWSAWKECSKALAASRTSGEAGPDLHAAIMNLPCEAPAGETIWRNFYRQGHRDARHAAAELALASQPQGVSGEMADALRLILPMAKGYAAAHPVGSNAIYIEQAEAVLASAPQGVSGWIPWYGGAQPVPDDVVVHVRLRSGIEDSGIAGGWSWVHGADNLSYEIIAYRLAGESSYERIDPKSQEIADLRNIIQCACIGGLSSMIEAWKKYFPDAPVPTVAASAPQGGSLSDERIEEILVEVGPTQGMYPESRDLTMKKIIAFARAIESELRSLAAPGQEGRAVPMKGGFFAYDNETGFDTYDTAEEAQKAAEEALSEWRDAARTDGEWPQEVDGVCWGVLLARVQPTDPDEFGGIDYEIRQFAAAPTQEVKDELPGMWEAADLGGGATDCAPSSPEVKDAERICREVEGVYRDAGDWVRAEGASKCADAIRDVAIASKKGST